MAFGIQKGKVSSAVDVPGDRAHCHIVSHEIPAHARSIGCGEADFGEEVCGRVGSRFRKRYLLVLIDDETRTHQARAAGVARGEAENLAVKGKRLRQVREPEADVRDAGDWRSHGLILGDRGKGGQEQKQSRAEGERSALRVRAKYGEHDARFYLRRARLSRRCSAQRYEPSLRPLVEYKRAHPELATQLQEELDCALR